MTTQEISVESSFYTPDLIQNDSCTHTGLIRVVYMYRIHFYFLLTIVNLIVY